MSEDSFGFTKDTELISRRPSFSESLKGTLKEKPKRGNGFLLKKSSAGRWNKRWFVVHGHYISYYKHDPSTDSSTLPQGALDLWHVEGVSLDDCTISLRLSPHAFQARMEEMGGGTAKKIISASISKTLAKKADHARRRVGSTPAFSLKASSPEEALSWLVAMRETPLMGSLAQLQKALQEDNTKLIAKELRVSLPPKREFIFADVSSMFDGATDILIRGVPKFGSMVTVLVGTGDKNSVEGTAPFEPELTASNGCIIVPLPSGVNAKVDWARKNASIPETGAFVGAGFIGTFLVTIILFRNWKISLILAVIAAIAILALLFQKQKSINDVIITGVSVTKSEGASPPGSPSSPKMGRKGKKEKPAIKLGISKDPNITPEEAGMIEVLRERIKDMWNVPADADALIKKYEKFFREWHADLGAIKNPAKRKVVMDKHINEDYRIVRFLRARKHNVNKAEEMLRDSLTWRVVLGSDEITKDPELASAPSWLLEYFGSPRLIKIVKNQEDRLNSLYLRDKEGHLALFVRAGRLTSRKIFRKMSSKPCFMVKYLVRTVEICRLDLELLKEQSGGKIDTEITFIIDLEGFAVSEQLPIGDLVALARRFFPIFATGYPELLHRVLVFNAPWLFGTLWSAVKPFIPEEVQEKVQIHSGEINYDKHIRPYFSDEYIPKYFGGKLVDPEDGNEFCHSIVPPYAPYVLPNEGAKLLEGIEPQSKDW